MRATLARSLVARAARRAPGRARARRARSRARSASDAGAEALAEALARHESRAARLSFAEEARVILDTNGCGALSTLGNQRAGVLAGFPCGSVAAYASDEDGLPIFALSALSQHARDARENGKATLTVTRAEFEDVSDGRVSMSGILTEVDAGEATARARARYLARHPGAFWVDFGDFAWYKMTEVVAIRIVGGFARAGSVTVEEYANARPDPVAAFSAPVCGHMNADHGDSLRDVVKHYVGVDVDSVEMRSIDALGMNCRVVKDGEKYACRLPFESAATGRKEVKDQIVLMTRNAAAAANAQ